MINKDKVSDLTVNNVVYHMAYDDREHAKGKLRAFVVGYIAVVVNTDDNYREVRRIECVSRDEAEMIANIYNDIVAQWYN